MTSTLSTIAATIAATTALVISSAGVYNIVSLNRFMRQSQLLSDYEHWKVEWSAVCEKSRPDEFTGIYLVYTFQKDRKSLERARHAARRFLSLHSDAITDFFGWLVQPTAFLRNEGIANGLNAMICTAPLDAYNFQQKLKEPHPFSAIKIDNWGVVLLLIIESQDKMHLNILRAGFKELERVFDKVGDNVIELNVIELYNVDSAWPVENLMGIYKSVSTFITLNDNYLPKPFEITTSKSYIEMYDMIKNLQFKFLV
jgi:hypothetical protein